MKSLIRKRLGLIARFVVVAVIFLFIFRKVSFPSVEHLLTWNLLWVVFFASTLGLLQAFLCTVRWRLIARVWFSPPALTRSFWAYNEGLFCNQALPSFVGGDALRVMRWRESGVTLLQGSTSVFLDRVFGATGASLLAIAACGLMMNSPVELYKLLSATGLSLAVLLGAPLTFMLAHYSLLFTKTKRFRRIHLFIEAIRAWAPRKSVVFFIISLATIGQIISGLGVYVIALVIGINLSILILVSITGIILLMSMIPISFAGWGVREAGFIALLVPLGVASSDALALGIAFGLSQLVSSLPGGISMLLGLTRRNSSSEIRNL